MPWMRRSRKIRPHGLVLLAELGRIFQSVKFWKVVYTDFLTAITVGAIENNGHRTKLENIYGAG